MTHIRFAAAAAICLSVFQANLATALTYQATILHPAGFATTSAQGNFAGSQSGWGYGTATGGIIHALLWNGTPASVVDLHPAGYYQSESTDISGSFQSGIGTLTLGGSPRALAWNSTAASVVDLHPAGFTLSAAHAISGITQVGVANGGAGEHAALWTGTAASFVDLNPTGYKSSAAYGVSGLTQAGAGILNFPTATTERALLWSGTAASFVDLHPIGFDQTRAENVAGLTQVGSGSGPSTSGQTHALLWHGTAASVLDLHPAGYVASRATDVSTGKQVGEINDGTGLHAAVWAGSAASVVDLHQFLVGLGPTFNESTANSINFDGSIVGSATVGGEAYAILWTPIPEPSTLLLAALPAAAITFIRRRK